MPAEEISHRFGLGGSTGQNLEKHTSQRIVLKFGGQSRTERIITVSD